MAQSKRPPRPRVPAPSVAPQPQQPAAGSDVAVPVFVVTVDGTQYTMDLERDITISNTWEGINDALVCNAKQFARWGALEVRVTQACKRRYAELFAAMRVALMGETAQGTAKPPSAEVVKQAVLESEEYSALAATAQLLETGRTALKMRMDAVLELARNMRSELEAGLLDKRQVVGSARAEAKLRELYPGGASGE